MKGLYLLPWLVGSFITLPLQAAQERGNGGDVIICKHPQTGAITSMEMADLYEARTIRNIPLDLGGPHLDPVAKAHLAVERIQHHDPERAAYLHAAIDGFMAKVWLVDFELPDLNDTGEITLEPNCTMQQIALHKEPETADDLEFWIRRAFWEHPSFNNEQKAALILHEVVFGKLIEQGHLDSRKARAFVSYLASPLIPALTYDDYEKRMLVRLAVAAHFFRGVGYGDIGGRWETVEYTSTVYHLPQRKLSFGDTIALCRALAPQATLFGEYGGFASQAADDRGVTYRQTHSLLKDLSRTQSMVWMTDYFKSDRVLMIDESGQPQLLYGPGKHTPAAACHCISHPYDQTACKPY